MAVTRTKKQHEDEIAKLQAEVKELQKQLQNSSSSLDSDKQAKLRNLLNLLKDWKTQTELVEQAVTNMLQESESDL